MKITDQQIGTALAIAGTLISAAGTIVNTFSMDHILALHIWFFSNPIMLAYFIGHRFEKWNGRLSLDAMIALYILFTISTGYAELNIFKI